MPKVLLAVILTATAALAQWQPVTPTPPGQEPGHVAIYAHPPDHDPHIYALFPDIEEDETWFWEFNIHSLQWSQIEEDPGCYLYYTAMTYQTLENGVLWVVANDDCGDPILWWYDFGEEVWDEEDIDDFALEPRPALAYRPNPEYNQQLYPVPGWLYCLPGEGETWFWRYWIPSSMEEQAVDGIYPPNGSIIADNTPLFLWQKVEDATEYWLQVSCDEEFSSYQMDVQTENPEYQTQDQEAFDNGVWFWRTASNQNGQWSEWSEVHEFQVQAGWEQLTSIPQAVCEGAAMVYISREESGDSLFVFVGGGNENFYRYHIGSGEWHLDEPTLVPQNVGSAMASSDRRHNYIYAILGEESDRHYWYNFRAGSGEKWEWAGHDLPEDLYAGAFLAHVPFLEEQAPSPGVEWPYPYIYLTVGEDEEGNPRHTFYRHWAHMDDHEGAQSSSTVSAGNRARLTDLPGKTVVCYHLNSPSRVRIAAYDLTGRLVKNLFTGYQEAGEHHLTWNRTDATGRKLSTGAYFITVDTGEREVLKMIER